MVYNKITEREESPQAGQAAGDGGYTMKQFEIGSTYSMRSACNHDCVWAYTVTARTAQTITITDGKETLKLRINKRVSEYRAAESVFPLGQYSMAPILSADKAA